MAAVVVLLCFYGDWRRVLPKLLSLDVITAHNLLATCYFVRIVRTFCCCCCCHFRLTVMTTDAWAT
jgi:hypothetical protein